MSIPRVSVVLPVFNAAAFVGEAVESVLGQTYGDFELIVIDDGSTDGSAEVVEDIARGDERVRIVRRENRGLIETLNEGIGLARGEFVARMDADDVSLPERFARQVAVLDARPHLGVLGTWVETFGGAVEILKYPESAEGTLCSVIFRCPLAHPTVMMRRSLFSEEDFAYDSVARHAEDFALWLRVAGRHELANLPEVLLRYRTHAGQVSAVHASKQRELVVRLQLGFLRERLGIEATEQESKIHSSLAFSQFDATTDFFYAAEKWLLTLAGANEQRKRFPREAFLRTLVGRWVSVHREARNEKSEIASVPEIFAPFVHPGAI